MRQHLYPETLRVLAYYWLKTAYCNGYTHAEWKVLYRLLDQVIRKSDANPDWQSTLTLIREWVRDGGLLSGDAPAPPKPDTTRETRQMPNPESLGPYFVRLLNDWVPRELAQLLIDEQNEATDGPNVPALAVGRSIERLLLREHLSSSSLRAVFQSELFSPRFVNPADYETLRDVVLHLLGRTDGEAVPVLPAELVWAAPDAHFSPDYTERVRTASTVNDQGDELRVPLAAREAADILEADTFRITSLITTMDGRWWVAYKLAFGDQNAVVYRPEGRLRLEYSFDHARMRLPWPESRSGWNGPVSFPDTLAIFGRLWRVAEWEQAVEQTWLNLVCTGPLPATTMGPNAQVSLRRCRPAAIDIAWTALEAALEASLMEKGGEPIEKLRRDELIPLGRALLALAECARSRKLRTTENILARLGAVAYHSAALRQSHGYVPWRVVPEQVRGVLLDRREAPEVSARLDEIFEGLPIVSAERPAPTIRSTRLLERILNRRASTPEEGSRPRAA